MAKALNINDIIELSLRVKGCPVSVHYRDPADVGAYFTRTIQNVDFKLDRLSDRLTYRFILRLDQPVPGPESIGEAGGWDMCWVSENPTRSDTPVTLICRTGSMSSRDGYLVSLSVQDKPREGRRWVGFRF